MLRRKKLDALGLCFVLVVAVLLGGTGYLAFSLAWLHSVWELAGVVTLAALVIILSLVEGAPAGPPQLADVIGQKAHGDAREATEAEAIGKLQETRGDGRSGPKREFPN